MEIGTWNGQRSFLMIKTAQQFHPGSAVIYHGFDLFEEMTPEKLDQEISKLPPTRNEVLGKLQVTSAHIQLYRGDTRKTLPLVIKSLPPMDFIFIDGGHSLETIANDWHYVQKLMHQKTVVVFDDYWENREDAGAKPIIDKIDKKKFNVEILKPQDRFTKPAGVLKINFVKVTAKNNYEQKDRYLHCWP